MELTTVHLVRHGEVDNPQGILYGRRPGFKLTELGQQMARGLGETFSHGHDVRVVYTSPLQRAIETGTPTARAFNLEVKTNPDLIEADNNFEGIAINDNRWKLLLPKYWWWYRNLYRPSWGEPYKQVAQRMMRAVEKARKEALGGEAVLVSHQLPIVTARRFVQGQTLAHDPRKRECSLASVTSFTYAGEELVKVEYWEPVKNLLQQAQDMVPGTSVAQPKKQN